MKVTRTTSSWSPDGDADSAASPERPGTDDPAPLQLEFCGVWTDVSPAQPFAIGREAELEIDDNPYLHRRFLELRHDRLWWLANVGSQLSATVSDADGLVQAWLAPGAQIPLVFEHTILRFTAGPTTYELTLQLDGAPMAAAATAVQSDGTTTVGRMTLTADQRLLIVALAESALRETGAPSQLPSSADAAGRLGWTLTKFNRKLDNVCDKLTKAGVSGLHGGPGKLASSRRARLVEYAVATRMVTAEDLGLLPRTG